MCSELLIIPFISVTSVYISSTAYVWFEGTSILNTTLFDILRFSINTPPINNITFVVILSTLSIYIFQIPLTAALVLATTYTFYIEGSAALYSPTHLYGGINPLLLNSLSSIHPLMLYVGAAFLLALSVYLLWGSLFSWLVLLNSNLSVYTTCSVTTLLMGGWWAFQESSWGGFWVWEISEFLLLALSGVFLLIIHYLFSFLRVTLASVFFINGCFVVTSLWFLTNFEFVSTLHTFFEFNTSALDNFGVSVSSALLATLPYSNLCSVRCTVAAVSVIYFGVGSSADVLVTLYCVLVYTSPPILYFLYVNIVFFGICLVGGYPLRLLRPLHQALLLCFGVQLLWLFTAPPTTSFLPHTGSSSDTYLATYTTRLNSPTLREVEVFNQPTGDGAARNLLVAALHTGPGQYTGTYNSLGFLFI